MESSVAIKDLVEPDQIICTSKSNNDGEKMTPEGNPHQNTDSEDGDDLDAGSLKVVKKRLQQFSSSESDDDSTFKTNDESDDKSRPYQGKQKDHKYGIKGPVKILKKRIQQFADSESDYDNYNKGHVSVSKKTSSDSDEDLPPKTKKPKSRIKIAHNCDSSDSGSSAEEALKNEQQQLRIKGRIKRKNKRNKLKEKFKSLVTSRLHELDAEKVVNSHSGSGSEGDNINNACSSEHSDRDETSVERIKQIIKDNTVSYKTTICDPDTSDEENYSVTESKPKKKVRKSAILTSPKPVRMTAKQAMENMKKIKSESNRMLREKEVTLPYHRPKALSLKDIMSRRKPAVSSDGKSLPIKMNEDQLKQYAKMLEERQKEMMELCKSDTDDDPEEDEPKNIEESNNLFDYQKPSETLNQIINEELNQNVNKSSMDNNEISSNNNEATVDIDDNKVTNVVCVNTDETKNTICEKAADAKSENTENVATDVVLDLNSTVNINDAEVENNAVDKEKTANDSMNSSASNAEMSLVYNDSIEESASENAGKDPYGGDNITCETISELDINQRTEPDSQLVYLHYDTEKDEINSENVKVKENEPLPSTNKDISDIAFDEVCRDNDFSDDDMINMDEIDNLIENADILKDNKGTKFANSPMLINDPNNSNLKPKLTGTPGMVIDLDDTDAVIRKKLTGLELLKERFTYFAKLKTPEEFEREKEKRLKPGAQHLKLKHELEEKISEQRSLEWAKRLEEEKKQQMEIDSLRGDESEDEIEKMEAKLDEKEEILNEEASESEESEEEIQEVEDKPRKRNPMIDDEAEESDVEECAGDQNDEEEKQTIENDVEDKINDDSDNTSEESSESEEETEPKTKKGRILKAFEDSDEEDVIPKDKDDAELKEVRTENKMNLESQVILESQDDDLQLAQRHKSHSADLFTSQDSAVKIQGSGPHEEINIGTQTFSILNDTTTNLAVDLDEPEKIDVICETQPNDDPNLDAVVGMCSGSFTQNLVDSQIPSTGLPGGDKLSVISKTQPNDEPNLDTVVGMCSGSFSQNFVNTQLPADSQPIGEDILNLCTGKFYDNQFLSQTSKDVKSNDESQILTTTLENEKPIEKNIQDDNLNFILEELNDPEFEEPKPKKYFMDNPNEVSNVQFRKKFIIDSDDEANNETSNVKQKKKIKKKRLEKRALQISDDEEDECAEEFEDEEVQDYLSEEDADRLVEYDSEENEVEIKPQKEKKKRKMAEFFEQEAELTSEDEWAGSGDEDEAGLDRLEREAGDDDTFHQGALQRELGQIHLRDVLDQDKREVRLLQELLFEDGDLGDGHRQRKFRWRNADGEEETGTVPEELADTQEEEMESEEQWRKQRHERELFLRQMQNQDEEEINVSISRTAIIKANLLSRTMSSVLAEANKTIEVNNTKEESDSPVVLEKKLSNDIPSPKKAFTVFQQKYHGSLLSRGGAALARLGALAAPLARSEPARPAAAAGNFVFTALSQPDPEPKVTKRKADTNVGTPRLVKKMKTEDKKKAPRSSLLDHFKV